MKNKSIQGFTLVELSVVLLIIGLIVGGTMAGVAMIRASENKVIISRVDQYKTALTQFEMLYSAIPGDMKTATRYWSGSANGDGDRTIDAEPSDEPFRALEQLELAELIQGTFTGLWGTGFVVGDSGNVPDIVNGVSLYPKCCSTTDYARTLDFNNHLVVFSVYLNDDYRIGAISPIDALSIDKKLDDGIPDFGLVGGSGSYNGTSYGAENCYSGTGNASTYNADDATYKDQKECQMHFAYDWN